MKMSTQKYKQYLIRGGLILVALLIIVPIVLLFLNSLKTTSEMFAHPFGLPQKFLFSNYVEAWDIMKHTFLNSALVTSVTVIGVAAIAPTVAYPLSRMEFKGRNIIMYILMFGLYIIPTSVIVPELILQKYLGLVNSRLGLALVYISLFLPIGILMMRSFFSSMSETLAEAGRIDGLSEFEIFWKIYLPSAKSMLLTLIMIITVYTWNEYLFALVLIRDAKLYTVPLMLASLGAEYATPWNTILAAVLLSAIPMILMVIFFSDRLKKGMALGVVE